MLDKLITMLDWVFWYAFLAYLIATHPVAGIAALGVTLALQGAAYIA